MNSLVVYSARIYDATEVFQLKKEYDKDRKRKPRGKNKQWHYMDEVELVRSKSLLGAAVDRLRSGVSPPQEATQVSKKGFKF